MTSFFIFSLTFWPLVAHFIAILDSIAVQTNFKYTEEQKRERENKGGQKICRRNAMTDLLLLICSKLMADAGLVFSFFLFFLSVCKNNAVIVGFYSEFEP